ncbi:hypothetical protein SLA2020_387150 [Shorea laevis]
MEKMIMGSIFLPMLLMQCFMAALAMSQPNFTTDQFALLEFKAHITSDPLNIMSSNWTSATPICNWVGLSCGALHRRVTTLDLPNMNLTGSLPPQLGNLSFLVDLNLSGNNFHGHLPLEVGKLQRLRVMDLSNNLLYGSIPDDIWLLSKLEIFKVGSNQLTGTISRNIGNLTKLRRIDIGDTKIRGEILQEIGNLHNLEEFAAGNASLYGRCKKLQNLSLVTNRFTGYIPRSIGNLTELTKLFLGHNNLEGEIPEEVGNLPLKGLNLGFNFLTGSIPPMIFNISTLEYIFLTRNNLSSHLPSTIGLRLPKLTELHLNQNKLSGNFPNSITNSSLLTALNLNENSFYGPFPNSLGHLRFLEMLALGANMFHEFSTPKRSFFSSLECKIQGNIPIEIGNLSNLIVLSLVGNDLTGLIPTTIGRLQQLQGLYFESNRLQGTIPNDLCHLKGLYQLLMDWNQLNGSMPECLANLTSLGYLDLHSNNLSSTIPSTCWSLKNILQVYLSSNSFSGPIPLDFGKLSVLTNMDLSRNQLLGNLPSTIGDLKDLTYLSLAENALEGNIPQSFDGEFWVSIQWDTSRWNEHCNKGLQSALQSFDTECEVLRNFHHRNLVKIISTCCNEDFKALVLEFMPNGTLEKWLYSDTCCLNILQRLDIVIDVACALEYLHHGHSVSIIHCDLKPSNVLLDEDMVAHVGDFGLAKLLGEGASMMQTMQIATIGYMAPEYGSLGMVSTKGDVYSYGILVMETFTRRKPTDKMFAGEMSLKAWVNESLCRSRIDKVVDANLMAKEKHFIAKANCVSSVLEVALNCCAETPKVRRNMMDVVAMLKKIKNQYLKDIGN